VKKTGDTKLVQKILNDRKLFLTFFKCHTRGKTVHCGTCIKGCKDIDSCSIISEIVAEHTRPVYILEKIRRIDMAKYIVIKERSHSLETTESLEKKSLPAKAKIYALAAEYKVVNKVVPADRKVEAQKDMMVFDEKTNTIGKLKSLDLNTGDTVFEVGKEFKIATKLIRVKETRKKRKRNAVQR